MFFVYILHSLKARRYYISNAGGTLSTKAFRPWEMVYTENFDTLKEAGIRERQIKS